MEKDNARKIFEAVKADDLRAFSALTAETVNFSLCYGRFPILSLCYLYKSRKIAARFETELTAVSSYIPAEEYYEIYGEFRKYAGRSLRLYVNEKGVISPLEMLAVTGQSLQLRQSYQKQYKDDKTEKNIETIYKITHGRTVKRTEKGVDLGVIRLTNAQRIIILIMLIAAVAMIITPFLTNAAFKSTFGEGSEANPYRVYNEKQLKTIFSNKDSYFSLAEDITIPENYWMGGAFSGTLDGGGHTVYISGAPSKGFISRLEGTVKNVKFVFQDIKKTVTENTSFLVGENAAIGTLLNVSVTVTADLASESHEGEILTSVVVSENLGLIKSCVADINIEYKGSGSGDVFITGFAAINKGTISDCSTTDSSVIVTDTVDVTGIVTVNSETGMINGCVNNADIIQTTASGQWNPNAAGFAVENSGTIKNCENNGDIKASSSFSGTLADNVELFAIAGGIACSNYGVIEKTKNTGDITAVTERCSIMAGGIAAFAYYASSVTDSCSYGKITGDAVDDKKVYVNVGGIVGRCYGAVMKSFSVCEYSARTDNGNTFIGGIMGTALDSQASSSKNYYLKKTEQLYGIGAVIVVSIWGEVYYEDEDKELLDFGTTPIESADEMAETEVYWK